MFKNVGLHRLTLLFALIFSAFTAIWYLVIIYWQGGLFQALWFIGLVVASFAFSYFLIRIVLEKYIYRRIKLIYKTIRSSKMSTPQKSMSLKDDEHILGDVEEEVVEWAESQEREIETLKSLEIYRKRYLGNVSHELKTPIFSIQGFIHTLLDGALEDENVNRRYLERAASNVERLLTIVYDLETITKLESGELTLDIQSFDIRALVREVIADLEFLAMERGIKLIFKGGADRQFFVKGDPEYIRQVVNNLILNSIKYGKVNGVTKVSFYNMHNQVLIEISDDGIGIEEKHLKHLFDRFYRVDKSRSRDRGGSGLGLSIVKHILEVHNQTINVRSTPGMGSTFGFTLDLA